MAQSVGSVALDIVMGKNTVSGVVRQAMSEVQSTMNSTTASVGDKVTAVGNACTRVGSSLLPVSMAVGKVGISAVQTAADFESAMSQVQAISGATGSDFVLLQDKAQEMGRKTKFSASQSAEAMTYMAMAGWKTTDMLGGIEGIMNLAAASGEDLATTSDIVTDALTAFGKSAKDSGELADVMAAASSNANTNVGMMGETFKYAAPVAGALGYTMQDTALAIGLMANAGIKGSQAGTSLRSMFSRLASPPKECATAMEKLGLSITNADGTMKPFRDVIGDLRTKFADLSEAEQAQYAKAIAGQEAMSGLLAIVNAAPSDLDKLTSAIDNSNGSAEKMATTMNDNLSGRMTLLKSQLEGVAIEIGTSLTPVIDKCITAVSKFADWFTNLDDNTKQTIVTIGTLIVVGAPLLIVLGKVVSSVGSLIKLGTSVVGVVGKVSGAIKGISGAASVASGGIGGLSGVLAALTSPIGIVIGVIALLVGAFIYLWNTNDEFRQNMTDTWNRIKETCAPIIEKLQTSLSDLWEKVLKPFIDWIGENVAPVIESAFQTAGDILAGFLETANGVIEFITGVFTLDWDLAWQGVQDTFDGCWETIQSTVDTIPTIIGAIHNPVGTLGQFVGEKLGGAFTKADTDVKISLDNINTNVENTKSSVGSKIDELKTNTSQKWETISTDASNKWASVRDTVTTKADEISSTVGTKFEGIKTDVSGKWQAINETVAPLLESFRYLHETVHQAIEILVGRALDAVKAKVNEIWSSITTTLSPILDGIKTNITNAWESAKTSVINATNNVKATVLPIWNNIKTTIGTHVDALRTKVSNEWNKIKTDITTKSNSARTSAVNTFNNMKSGISNVVSSIYNVVKAGFDRAINFIKGLASQAYNWGKDFIDGLVRGIKSSIGKVSEAVTGVADKIRATLHFSVPDEGPLTDYESWMPDFIQGMAKGIDDNKYRLVDAVQSMAGDMKLTMPMSAPMLKNVGGYNTPVQTDTEGNNRLVNMLTQLVENLQYNTGDITIPIYLGNDLIDERIVSANDRRTLRSGGRA